MTVESVQVNSTAPYWTPNESGTSGAGAILALASFTPGANIQTDGTSFDDVDATNAVLTFTAPASGKVLITASAWAEVVVAVSLYWGLQDEAGNNIAGSEEKVLLNGTGGGTLDGRPNYEFLYTGLTPGNEYTVKLAHRVSSGNSGFILQGPVVMKAVVAPF